MNTLVLGKTLNCLGTTKKPSRGGAVDTNSSGYALVSRKQSRKENSMTKKSLRMELIQHVDQYIHFFGITPGNRIETSKKVSWFFFLNPEDKGVEGFVKEVICLDVIAEENGHPELFDYDVYNVITGKDIVVSITVY